MKPIREVSTIETYYLVDYENVNSEGITGCNQLKESDHVYIFFTKNSPKVSLHDIANHGDASLEMYEIPAGKQSVDFHICSILGYIVGMNKAQDCSIVIISKDKDYDNVIKFWKSKNQVKCSRNQQIKKNANTPSTAKNNKVTSKSKPNTSGKKKTEMNQEIMKTVSEAGFNSTVATEVSHAAVGLYGKKNLALNVHNHLKKKYVNYLVIYRSIKPILMKYNK